MIRNLPACCLWAISGLWEWLSSYAKLWATECRDNCSRTATAVKDFEPQTLRIRFLADHPELLSQNTCCLHRTGQCMLIVLQLVRIQNKGREQTFSCLHPVCLMEQTPYRRVELQVNYKWKFKELFTSIIFAQHHLPKRKTMCGCLSGIMPNPQYMHKVKLL